MPQLMPLFWKFSVFFSILFLVVLMLFYGNVMNMEKIKFDFSKKLLEKWYW